MALAACGARGPEQPATGVAYAGPPVLNLRKDLASKSAAISTVKHGERLDVIEMRRRFVKVRTAQGVEGWTDSNLLLTEQQMEDLRQLAGAAAKLPSQGTATAFDALNMHATPSRQSPGFFQIAEGGAVEVIGHRVAPRTASSPQAQTPLPARRATVPKKAKGKDARASLGPPPAPPPAAPPRNWQDLSRPRVMDLPGYVPPQAPASAPVPLDDWSLVRTRDGKVGWVLARMLMMAIPDEVAQYAEGRRITSYMSLGQVQDGKETKHEWLWTTAGGGPVPYEFDSFRVFIWSMKRHRYETAYIERNVKGYFPIVLEAAQGQDEKAFSLVLEDKDGKLYKRIYGFGGNRVRMISKEPYQPPPPLPEVRALHSFDPSPAAAPAASSWKEKLRFW